MTNQEFKELKEWKGWKIEQRNRAWTASKDGKTIERYTKSGLLSSIELVETTNFDDTNFTWK